MWVNGVEVSRRDSFRVTMNNFLATGGDGFTVFNEGTDALGGAQSTSTRSSTTSARPERPASPFRR